MQCLRLPFPTRRPSVLPRVAVPVGCSAGFQPRRPDLSVSTSFVWWCLTSPTLALPSRRHGREWVLPGSQGTSILTCPVLRPRRGLLARPVRRVGVAFRALNHVGPRKLLFRGSIARPARSLPTLRNSGYPSAAQRLASGWRPTLARWAWHPKVPSHNFKKPTPSIPSAWALPGTLSGNSYPSVAGWETGCRVCGSSFQGRSAS